MLLTGFGSVNVNAATNLVNPNLDEWEYMISSGYDSVQGTGEMNCSKVLAGSYITYYLQPTLLGYTGSDGDVSFYFGITLDETLLSAGKSYTFNMHILSPDEIRARTTFTWSDERFASAADGFFVGFGIVDSDGEIEIVLEFLSITAENYLSLAGTDFVSSFTCPDYSGGNPCIVIMASNAYSTSTMFFDDSMTLVDNSEEDEEGFFSRLFEWFEKKFNAIGDSFSNLGNKLSTGFSNLGDRIKTFFSDLGDSISSGLTTLKEGIQERLDQVKTTLVELGETIINGIKSLFIPTNENFMEDWKARLELLLQEHLGIVWESANFIKELLNTVSDLLSDTEDGSIEIVFPGVEFELLGHNFNLWEERTVDMSFLETDGFWSFWYGLYKIILVIVLCFALVLYGYNVFERILR